MKKIILTVLTLNIISFADDGVKDIKYIRDLGDRGAYYTIICKDNTKGDVLYEKDGSWYSVPPNEPYSFYKGHSVKEFAKLACSKDSSNETSSYVKKISGGIGSTASGIKSYTLICKNGVSYDVTEDSYSKSKWSVNDATFSGYNNLNIKNFSEVFCKNR